MSIMETKKMTTRIKRKIICKERYIRFRMEQMQDEAINYYEAFRSAKTQPLRDAFLQTAQMYTKRESWYRTKLYNL